MLLTDIFKFIASFTYKWEHNTYMYGAMEGRVDKGSIKYRPSTLQSREDYTVNKLNLADREKDKLFNENI